MDPTELAALRKLAEREYWDVDQLPAYFDVDLCLCLDDAGLIEARHVTMLTVRSSLPREPIPKTWHSPLRVPGTGTTWRRILAARARDEFNRPYQGSMTWRCSRETKAAAGFGARGR